MRRLAMIRGVVLCSLLAAPPALAQEGEESEEPVEYSQTVRVTLYVGEAEVHVRVEARNPGRQRTSAEAWFAAPGVVGTNFVLFDDEGKRLRGRLWPAQGAENRFLELAGPGYSRRDPGWMRRQGDGVAISVLPILPGGTRTFEYDVVLPTHYDAGKHWVNLGEVSAEGAHPSEVQVVAGESGGRLWNGQRRFASGATLAYSELQELGLELPEVAPIAGQLAAVGLNGRAFAHFEAQLATELEPVPDSPALVVAVDSSRSMGPRLERVARAVARAYLARFKSPRVRVVHFARHVSWLQSDFVSREQAVESLRAELSLENGSSVGEALEAAAAALRDVQGPTRILLLTDGRTDSATSPLELHRALGATSAILHVAVLREAAALDIAARPGNPWEVVTRPTGGMVWEVQAPPELLVEPALGELVEPWTHPTMLERVRWQSDGLPLSELPDRIEPGERVVVDAFTPGRVNLVTLRGELWSRPIEVRFARDASGSQRWQRLLLGSEHGGELSRAEDAALAEATHSVSTTRSLLALEPSVAPAGGSDGLSQQLWSGAAGDPNAPMSLFSVDGLSISDCAGCWERDVTYAVAGGLGISTPSERERDQQEQERRQRLLARLFAPVTATCHVESGDVLIETTLNEVVSVVARVSPESARSCVEAAGWQLSLQGELAQREQFVVPLRAASVLAARTSAY